MKISKEDSDSFYEYFKKDGELAEQELLEKKTKENILKGENLTKKVAIMTDTVTINLSIGDLQTALLASPELRRELIDVIMNHKLKPGYWGYFYQHVIEDFREVSANIVREYIRDYGAEGDLKNLVDQALRGLTKKEILEKILK